MKTFREMGLENSIQKAVEELGFLQPTPIQEKVIPRILESPQDIIGLAQTGTGKTAAYGVPMIQMIGVKDNPAFNDGLDSFKNEEINELSDRILFGSDFPNIPYQYENSIQGWLQREMEPSFYEKLFFRNAELLFSDYL